MLFALSAIAAQHEAVVFAKAVMGQKGIRILAWNVLVGLIFLELTAQIYRVAKSPYQPFLKTEIMSGIKNYLKYVNHSRDQSFPLGLQKASKKPVN